MFLEDSVCGGLGTEHRARARQHMCCVCVCAHRLTPFPANSSPLPSTPPSQAAVEA